MAFVDCSPPAPTNTELPPRDQIVATEREPQVSCSRCHKPCRSVAGLIAHAKICRGVLVTGFTREQHRSRRKREVRAHTVSVKSMGGVAFTRESLLYPKVDHDRPKTRGECAEGPRPCPFVSCKWHLYLDVNPTTGSIKFNYPDLEPEQLSKSCALDVADNGGEPLETVGEIANLTRERIRQIEVQAIDRLHALPEFRRLRLFLGDEPRVHVPGPSEPDDSFPEQE